MINKILNHEYSPHFCAGSIALGATLLLIGSLTISHGSIGAGFCAAGGITTAGALFFTAMKIDHYLKVKRMKETQDNPQAPYIPSNPTAWRLVAKRGASTLPIAEPGIYNDDPAVRRNTNFGEDANRLVTGESKYLHDQL